MRVRLKSREVKNACFSIAHNCCAPCRKRADNSAPISLLVDSTFYFVIRIDTWPILVEIMNTVQVYKAGVVVDVHIVNKTNKVQLIVMLMELVKSQKDKNNLIHNRCRLRKDRLNSDGSTSWRCVVKVCKGRVKVDSSWNTNQHNRPQSSIRSRKN
jgi:hypothetical protein